VRAFVSLVVVLVCTGCSSQVGGCIAGERHLQGGGVVETPRGLVTITAPSGTNIAVCIW
jgi:hypothetical protein